jgi:DNA recombination protein RmuC
MPSTGGGIDAIVLMVAAAIILILAIALVFAVRARSRASDGLHAATDEQVDALTDIVHAFRTESAQTAERLERSLRGDIVETARMSRAETATTLTQFQQTLTAQMASHATMQNHKIDGFAKDLSNLTQSNATQLDAARTGLAEQARQTREEQAHALKQFGETLTQQLAALSQNNDRRFSEVRATLEQKLKDIEVNNAQKLDEMRRTVDEKLHATLEQRLGESFKLVSDRLEQVHRGLGEMQTLAAGVGDLKKVLTNVKTRGTWGEVQLGSLLEQMLTPDQYAKNVATVPSSSERVEFAIRLPGPHAGEGKDASHATPVWLPIDAKFPREDYERLIEAQERADPVAVEEAGRALDARVRLEARRIADKYISPPHTTDFGLLFLPTEGLYAEVLRRPGLSDALQRDHRITIAGPTTLTALLNSLQMGFRTLAIERRSSEVWQVLGAVKTEFSKFGAVLSKTRSQLETVARSIDLAERRTRVMHRTLRDVEALPGDAVPRTLGQALLDEEKHGEGEEGEDVAPDSDTLSPP